MKCKIGFIFSLLLAVALAISWILSYISYGLVAYEAYSGVGTEFASVRGLIVFYKFDNYEDSRPPQNWGFGFLDPKSRGGERLKFDFNFWQAPGWGSRIGFFFQSSDPDIKHILVISIPHWFLLCVALCSAYFFYQRLPKTKSQTSPSTDGTV